MNQLENYLLLRSLAKLGLLESLTSHLKAFTDKSFLAMALVNCTTAFLGPVNHLSKAGLLLCQAALCLAQVSSLCLHLSQNW